jgi:PAS domain-containing protein
MSMAVLGHLAVLDVRPMLGSERTRALLAIFAARAGAELQRLRVEAQAQAREAKLAGLVAGAMDGIIEFDDKWRVLLANPAAEAMLSKPSALVGDNLRDFVQSESRKRLMSQLVDRAPVIHENLCP